MSISSSPKANKHDMSRSSFFILLLTAFSAMLGMGIISPFLPEFAQHHGANGFWLGMIFAGYGLSRGIIMPIIGKVSDMKGRKNFVLGGLFIFSFVSLCYPLVNSVYMLTLVRLLHGLAAGLIMPMVMAYIADITSIGEESQTTGILNMMFYFGLASGPIMGGIINKYLGFDYIFYAMSILGLISFVTVYIFLPESKVHTPKNLFIEIKIIDILKYDFIKAVLIIAVVCTLLMAVFVSFVPSLAETLNIGTFHISIILTTGIFLAGILQLVFGRIADKLDPLGKLIQIGIGTSISMFAIIVFPRCPDFLALLSVGSFIGLGASISAPALTGLSVLIGKKTGMGQWMGIVQAVMSLGFVITPLIAGVTFDYLGIDAVFYLIGLLAFFGSMGYLYFLLKRIKRGSLKT